jgi:hypothetical protein
VEESNAIFIDTQDKVRAWEKGEDFDLAIAGKVVKKVERVASQLLDTAFVVTNVAHSITGGSSYPDTAVWLTNELVCTTEDETGCLKEEKLPARERWLAWARTCPGLSAAQEPA